MADKGGKPKPQGRSSPDQTKDEKRHAKPWDKKVVERKKDPEAIPVLKYGPGNNFAKFRDALSKAALKEYGQLGKLIKQERLDKPEEPDRASFVFADPDGIDRAIYLEDLKQYRRKLEEYQRDAPKLYGLILQYLSDESMEAVKKDPEWNDIEADADPEKLWALVVQKHKVHSASEVEEIVKLSARQMYQNVRQGAYESIISYKERLDNALAVYND